MGEKPLVYKPEVCRIIDRDPKTLTAMLKRGEFLPPIRVGKRDAWPRAALMKYLGLTPGQAQEATQPAGAA